MQVPRSALRWHPVDGGRVPHRSDRKSTRLNSSHLVISYAVFCLKKKKKSVQTWTAINNVICSYQLVIDCVLYPEELYDATLELHNNIPCIRDHVHVEYPRYHLPG